MTDKAKQWYRERRTAKGNQRPLYLGLLDEDGKVLRALEIRADGEAEDVTEREREKPPRPRPGPAQDDDSLPQE